jgi:hypothetical protein
MARNGQSMRVQSEKMLETCLEAGTLHRRLFLAYFDHAVQAQSSD